MYLYGKEMVVDRLQLCGGRLNGGEHTVYHYLDTTPVEKSCKDKQGSVDRE